MKHDNESKVTADCAQTNNLVIDRGFSWGYQQHLSKIEDDTKLNNFVVNVFTNSKIS